MAARDGDEVLAACHRRRIGGLCSPGRADGGQRRSHRCDFHMSPLLPNGIRIYNPSPRVFFLAQPRETDFVEPQPSLKENIP
jgi:hypothetical protein